MLLSSGRPETAPTKYGAEAAVGRPASQSFRLLLIPLGERKEYRGGAAYPGGTGSPWKGRCAQSQSHIPQNVPGPLGGYRRRFPWELPPYLGRTKSPLEAFNGGTAGSR